MNQLPCFETLKELADQDPEAFEEFRQQSCLDYIETIPTPHQKRLRAVQFRVDYEIRNAKTPMAGLVKVSAMMHDSFYRMSRKLSQFTNLVSDPDYNPPTDKPANIVDISEWTARTGDSTSQDDSSR